MVAVLLAGSSIATAQVRLDTRGVHQPPIQNQGVQQPPTPLAITVNPRPTDIRREPAKLTIERRMGPRQFFFPCCVTWAFVGYAQFPYDVLSMQAGPVLENAPLGGLQLDIEPRSAQVYVDGKYTGLVSDFSGYFKHLEIAAGPHIVTVLAPAYEPLTISVVVVPERTITWRASLTRAYGR